MDSRAIDELYGDLGQEQYDSVLNHDEDSVDIYSGLENSPSVHGDNGEERTLLSPKRLKESMDLYEELVTEEQEERQATYNELKSKFDAAQSQVQELLAKLQQMQTQNSTLHKENILLKKNICALIKTARMEIVRKDEEISNLTKRCRGTFHPSRAERTEEAYLRNEASTGHSSNCTRDAVKKLLDQKARRGSVETPQHQDKRRLSSQSVCPEIATNATPLAMAVAQKSSLNIPLAPQHVRDHKGISSDRPSVSNERESAGSETEVISQNWVIARQKIHDEKAQRRLAGVEGGKEYQKQSDKQNDSQKHGSKEKDSSEKPQCNVGAPKLDLERRESLKMSHGPSKNQRQLHEDPVVLRRSGRSKSPSSKPQSTTPVEPPAQKSRGPPGVTADVQGHNWQRELQISQGEGRRSRETDGSSSSSRDGSSLKEKSRSEKSGASLDRNVEIQRSSERHRKEERRQADDGGSERRRMRSDVNKEHEQKKMREREGEGRNRQEAKSSRGDRRSTRSETSKDHDRRNAKESEGCITRGTADKSRGRHLKDGSHTLLQEAGRDVSSAGLDHTKSDAWRKKHDKSPDKRKTSSRHEEQPPRSKSSSGRDGGRGGSSLSHVSRPSSDRCSNKEKRVEVDHDKSRRRAEKEPSALDKTSVKTRTVSAGENRVSNETEKNEHKGQAGQVERVANMSVPSSTTSTSSSEVFAMVEESSPKRKLTFMETLNLTLSPVKKSSEALGSVRPPPEDAHVGNSGEPAASFELGEEFCVIDEINNSQHSVGNMDIDSVPTNDAVHLDPATVDMQHQTDQGVSPDSGGPMTDLHDVEKEGELEGPKTLDENMGGSSASHLEKMGINPEIQEESTTKPDTSQEFTESSACMVGMSVVPEGSSPVEGPELLDTFGGPLANVECSGQGPQTSLKNPSEKISERVSEENQMDVEPQASPPVQSGPSQDEVSTSATPEASSNSETPVCQEVVSSTDSVHSSYKSRADSAETERVVPDLEITKDFEKQDLCPGPLEGPQDETLNISSTVREEEHLPGQPSSSEPDSTENEVQNPKPSSSVVVPHDEDSMMLTLSNIKVIPEAISPLTSPVRQVKKVQQLRSGKEAHVKCLNKVLSTSATVTNKDLNKNDMNKENKRPDSSPTIPDILKDQEALSSTATEEEELEEGEIVSESEEEGALVIQSPPNKKMKSTSRSHQASPMTSKLEKKGEATPTIASKCQDQDQNTDTDSKDSPSSNKRRFKTVSAPSKSKISTLAEFTNMLSFIRSELRRKYMKLHKNVTKSAFCCIVDMSLASFMEFVDSVNFEQFCGQGNEIKPRLNKIICSIMSKVSNNGIVNRIFEQRADDLKQKLWTFVDGQFDFLFKEIKAELKGLSEVSRSNSTLESKRSSPRNKQDWNMPKILPKEPLSFAEGRPNEKAKAEAGNEGSGTQPRSIGPAQSLPPRGRGLGSRGKNIRATMEEGAQVPVVETSDQLPDVSSCKTQLQEQIPAPENKTNARRPSQNGSIQDKVDFDILTEQQTTSLTFNLVTDSQMGDIFRSLLQGSDLMEGSVSLGDNQSWPLNTPRKELQAGESLLGVMTPSKITPSKLINTWVSISPYKFMSPNSKIQMPLNPALLDESCMLEVPSNPLPHLLAPPLTTVTSHQPYSILAEDLAVSLTIPSPLKSDGHLSFLHPASGQPLSAPNSVISAHYSEDALLDGEDATEQDIHLSLDTDNSSPGSSTGGTWDGADQVPFQFKPNLPMQAEVMERSNDHFIVRIRQTSTGVQEEPRQESQEAVSDGGNGAVHQEDESSTFSASLDSGESPIMAEPQVISNKEAEAERSTVDTSSDDVRGGSAAGMPKTTTDTAKQVLVGTAEPILAPSSSINEEHLLETTSEPEGTSRKRRKHRSGPKAKRSRIEKSHERHDKQRHKKRSKSKGRGEKTPSKKEKKTPSPQLSPSSLSAKNVIRKKGEVVVTWTREEDRDILVELKTKGTSPKTFAALAAKLQKSPSQIEERFTQLMKLFKKKEKMEN